MQWLNYHHLLYFWTVVREGGVASGAAKLRLSQPTVSAQVHALEAALGERLFDKHGRRRVLTDIGRTVYQYADEIVSLGRELIDTIHDRPTGRPARLNIGVTDAMPKQLAYRVIAPALAGGASLRVVCREDTPERLFAALAIHELDLVLSDAPVPPGIKVKAFNRLVADCGIVFLAAPALARRLKGRFPRSLDGAPLLLPSDASVLRRALEEWLEAEHLRPVIVGEFDDSALMKSFGEAGTGVFTAPAIVEQDVRAQYRVRTIGRVEEVRERIYAVSAERRISHPALVKILEAANPRPLGVRRGGRR